MLSESDPFVDDIIKDARLIADYGRLSGAFKDDAFFVALADAEQANPRTLSDPAIIRLQKHLNDAARLIPFTTFAALHRNWTPRHSGRKSAVISALLVALSILLMAVTARLTNIYHQGTDLLAAVQQFQEQETGQNFGQMVRKMWIARTDPVVSNQVRDNGLSADSLIALDYDLRKTNGRLSNFQANLSEFYRDSQLPIFGMHFLYCLYLENSPTRSEAERMASAYGCGSKTYDSPEYKPVDMCANVDGVIPASANPDELRIRSDYLDALDRASARLICEDVIDTDPKTIDALLTFQYDQIRKTLSPYSLWILPALYGALGALMFQMRRILDPLSPNPQFINLIHRVALGALAGMILAWFMAPDTRFGDNVGTIGFGLFSFAFLFGFSIDVFFTLLDEFVAFADAAVRKIGSSGRPRDPEPSPPATPAAQQAPQAPSAS